MESSHFWPSFLHVALYKMVFFDFRFTPPNAQNLLPKTAGDNVTLTRRHPWSRSRSARQLCPGKVGNPLNFGADPCFHGNEIWARRGDLVAYRLVVLLSCYHIYGEIKIYIRPVLYVTSIFTDKRRRRRLRGSRSVLID